MSEKDVSKRGEQNAKLSAPLEVLLSLKTW